MSMIIPILVLVLGQGAASAAQTPQTPQAQAPPPTCSAPEHQQFDFWAGEWDVTAPNGQRAGGNRIERTLKGCALMEHWTSASGNEGTSINYYDRLTKQWYQSWMSDGGGALRMKGGLVDGSMVMETDPVTRPDGTTVVHKTTWTPNADGSVRQLWESTTDGGKTWTVAFDGMYVKKR
jgi:hypothetical protein